MKKVLLISTLGVEDHLVSFVKNLQKQMYFDDIILCNPGNREKIIFINEELALQTVFTEGQNYGAAFNQGVQIAQKKYSNENAMIVMLSGLFDDALNMIKKSVHMIEEDAYDLVYSLLGTMAKNEKNWWKFWEASIDYESSQLQLVRMRKLLQLKPTKFSKKWRRDLMRGAFKERWLICTLSKDS